MLWSGRITLVVMISAMVLTRSSAEEEPTFFSSLVSESHGRGISIRHSKSRCGKETDHGNKSHGTWDMKPLIVKLNTVLDRYEFNWEKVKKLYKSVEPCMPDKCGQNWHKKYKRLKRFQCSKFKSRKSLKQKLNIEVETLLTRKRLKNVTKRPAAPLPSVTLACLKELMTLHDSKMFLSDWKKNLTNVFTCWNEMKGTKGEVRIRFRSAQKKQVEAPCKQVGALCKAAAVSDHGIAI